MTRMKVKPATLLAVDGNWLVHRAYHMVGNAPPEAHPRMVARQVIAQVLYYAERHCATHIVLCFDGRDLQRRKEYPLYKANRVKAVDRNGNPLSAQERDRLILAGAPIQVAPDGVHDCQLATIELAHAYGIPVVQQKMHEADDLLSSAGALAAKVKRLTVVMCSRDKDIVGYLAPNVVQWYPDPQNRTDVTIRHTDLSAKLTKIVGAAAKGWDSAKFRAFQLLIGDSTDYIPQILSRGKAADVLNTHGSLAAYFKTKEGKRFYEKHEEEILRNRLLTRMRQDLFEPEDLVKFVPSFEAVPSHRAVKSVDKARAQYQASMRLTSSSGSLFDQLKPK